jgi:hypothetical protein
MLKQVVDIVAIGLLKDRENNGRLFSEPNSQTQSLDKWSSKRSGTW